MGEVGKGCIIIAYLRGPVPRIGFRIQGAQMGAFANMMGEREIETGRERERETER